MPIIAAAVGAAALASQAAPPIETSARPFEGGEVVQLSYTELASVTSPPSDARARAAPDLRLSGSAYAWQTGIRTIALSNGVGSPSQAITSLSVQVTLTR